jgi:hypothetical protein
MIMKPVSHYSQIPQTEKPMETFPQPHTIPEAWDMSDMFIDEESGLDLTTTAESTDETGSDSWDNH